MAKNKTAVLIVEWDGDRSSAVGGFNIKLRVGGGRTETLRDSLSYDTGKERTAALAKMRRKARALAEDLGVEVEEKLFT